ncbi:MAG: hypothetical protein ACT4OU_09305 [Hyphomicrobium sp.]
MAEFWLCGEANGATAEALSNIKCVGLSVMAAFAAMTVGVTLALCVQ